MAQQLNVFLKLNGVNSEFAPEYAREFIIKYGEPSLQDQFLIAVGQKETEDELAARHDVIVCDCTVFVSHIYAYFAINKMAMMASQALAGDKKPENMNLNPLAFKQELINNNKAVLDRIFEISLDSAYSYDLVFLVDVENTRIRNDGVRLDHDEKDRYQIFTTMKGFMDAYHIPYILLKGSKRYADLVDHVTAHLDMDKEKLKQIEWAEGIY